MTTTIKRNGQNMKCSRRIFMPVENPYLVFLKPCMEIYTPLQFIYCTIPLSHIAKCCLEIFAYHGYISPVLHIALQLRRPLPDSPFHLLTSTTYATIKPRIPWKKATLMLTILAFIILIYIIYIINVRSLCNNQHFIIV